MANFIITGANQGIGFYLVKQLLEDGKPIISICMKNTLKMFWV